MEFVDAEGAAEVLEHLAAMRRHVESRGEVVEHVVDEPRGEIEQELPLERLEDPFDAHAVFDDALQHQIPDLVVVLGLGEDALGCGAKGGGAATPGVILAVGDFQEGNGLVGDGANGSGQGACPSASLAAHWAGGFLGGAVNRYNEGRGCGYIRAHACVLVKRSCCNPIQQDASPIFQARNGLPRVDAWWGSTRTPLTLFLDHEPQESILKPIVFYHILKSEPIAIKVAEELVYPLLPIGRTNRDQVKDFVLKYLPEASDSSLKNMLRAIFYSYNLLGIGNVVGETLRFQLRPGEFESFLYVFTSEFKEPGIYTFDQLYQGPLHRWLLWDREWLRRQLYNLRDLGIISKISEIDSVKQFTVSLDQTTALQEYFSKSKDKALFLREKAEDISDTKQEYAEP